MLYACALLLTGSPVTILGPSRVTDESCCDAGSILLEHVRLMQTSMICVVSRVMALAKTRSASCDVELPLWVYVDVNWTGNVECFIKC